MAAHSSAASRRSSTSAARRSIPAEVESVLLELDNVDDATVYGERHPITGNIVVAELRLREPEDRKALSKRVRKHCRARLAPFKVPVKVHVGDASASANGSRRRADGRRDDPAGHTGGSRRASPGCSGSVTASPGPHPGAARALLQLDPDRIRAWVAVDSERDDSDHRPDLRRAPRAAGQARVIAAGYWTNLYIHEDYRDQLLYPRLPQAMLRDLEAGRRRAGVPGDPSARGRRRSPAHRLS